MKIFLINNNLRYKNNFILQEFFKEGNLLIYINIYTDYSNKYIFESYHLLELEKKLPIKILYIDDFINFFKNLKFTIKKSIELYGDLFIINWIKSVINGMIKNYSNNLEYSKDIGMFLEKNINFHILKSNLLIESYVKEYKAFKAFKNYYMNKIEKFNIIEYYDLSKKFNIIKEFKEYFLETQLKNLKTYTFNNFPLGEEEAYNRWNKFKKILKNYEDNRKILIFNKTSNLSAYINSGIISIEIIWNELLDLNPEHTLIFKEELLWREFAYETYYYIPSMIFHSVNKKFENIPWKYAEDNPDYNKWTKGETGFLLVDAAMKELNTTGYMFNRCRMVTSFFLIKNLKIHWLMGANYFMEKLIDFDYVLNSFNWQWVNGSGRNPNPYFRIFNPTLQLKNFDKNLEYVKGFLGNIKEHENNFPPIVDFNKSKMEMLDLYKKYLIYNK